MKGKPLVRILVPPGIECSGGCLTCLLHAASQPTTARLSCMLVSNRGTQRSAPHAESVSWVGLPAGNARCVVDTSRLLVLLQDNMEFMQWLKAYFDGQTGGQAPEGYDAKSRRASSRTGDVRTAGTGGRGRPRQASCPPCVHSRPTRRAPAGAGVQHGKESGHRGIEPCSGGTRDIAAVCCEGPTRALGEVQSAHAAGVLQHKHQWHEGGRRRRAGPRCSTASHGALHTAPGCLPSTAGGVDNILHNVVTLLRTYRRSTCFTTASGATPGCR
jgi:hypothetical protein